MASAAASEAPPAAGKKSRKRGTERPAAPGEAVPGGLARAGRRALRAGERLGRLYFHLGAAHEGLGDFPLALEYFRRASGHYGSAQPGARAAVCVRMGSCYLGARDPARAAGCFREAGRAYAEAASPGAAAAALSRASSSMLRSRRYGAAEIAAVLAECRALCASIPDRALQGQLYNAVGLGYSQLRAFPPAAESFERALVLCRGAADRRGEAALLQNLAAAHNVLGSPRAALALHQRAAALHGALGNRRAQGQCFGNLAYALGRLGDHEAAAESYLHALQAFRDAGDLQGQWQACEGLGASHLRLGAPEKAVRRYKEALRLLSRCRRPFPAGALVSEQGRFCSTPQRVVRETNPPALDPSVSEGGAQAGEPLSHREREAAASGQWPQGARPKPSGAGEHDPLRLGAQAPELAAPRGNASQHPRR
ncbi:tetratricopeptide repeat protein 24 [Apteryx rowi]|uniref:tetratricopeptide repeat protein 24 n=1 Tax=Apteryx rowi TaxID=308060 RepID=UPI000E1E1165|nr:tetratricopeptide repeat protein 24 [Apteryx rowi]